MIPIRRILDKLDECFARGDLEAADRLLDYWLAEAQATQDVLGEIQIRNEQLGLCRRRNERDKGLATAEALLLLLGDGVDDATVRLNIATNYCHFGCPDLAAALYPVVEAAYRVLPPDDERLAGLYNNMAAHAYGAHRYAEAAALYSRALAVQDRMATVPINKAITYVNRAMCRYLQNPLDERVDEDMMAGYDVVCMLHDIPEGDYTFVLDKVMPIYAHLGYTRQYEDMATRRARCGGKG